MFGRSWLCTAVVLAGLSGTACAEDLREIFYAPFDDTPNASIARGSATGSGGTPAEEGVLGKAGAANFDARGNVDLDRGTMAFWLKLPGGPVEMDWGSYVTVGGEGYYGFVMSPLMAIPEHFCMQFFNVGLYTQRLDWPYLVGHWKPGEWHHVAMVWDRTEGITLYEDGKRIGSNWGSYSWPWNLSPLHLSMSNGLIDEFHVYAAPLTDAQIAQLARKEKPTGNPIPLAPDAERREKDLARMGWLPDELGQLPVVPAGRPQEYTFARIEKCWDSKRAYAEPFDGFKASAWPHQIYGHSTRGRLAEIVLAPHSKYDRVTIFVQRAFQGTLKYVVPNAGPVTINSVNARDGSFWRWKMPEPATERKLTLSRTVGRIGEIQVYHVKPMADAPVQAAAAPRSILYPFKLEKMPASEAGLALLADTPARFDNPMRATPAGANAAKGTVSTPAFGGLQIITDAHRETLASDGILLTLVAEGMTRPTPVQIVVKEPVWCSRNWLVADALLQPKGRGRQVFTLRLRGRPVASFQKEFAMTVTAGEPVNWVMGKEGTSLEICTLPLEQALPTAIDDQAEFVRCGHYNVNEGHLFGEPIFDRPFRWLCKFAPDRPETRELVYLLGLPKGLDAKVPAPAIVIPKNDIGAPEWAFWQKQHMDLCRQVTRWWITNWQTPNGEFGGIWNDDTDFVENWIGMALCADDDDAIKESLRRIWEGLWSQQLEEGVSRYVMDDCHSYEEGMGTIAYQMLVDYGDPVAYERAMAASSHYDKWTRKLDDGTYRWKSAYFGVNGCWDYGAFASNSNGGMLVLIPANYLIWYNRNPDVAKYFLGLKGLAEGAGISADSYYLLTDPQALATLYATLAITPAWNRYPQHVGGMVSVCGVTDEIRKQFAPAEYAPLPPLAKYSFSAQTDDARNWLSYLTTGDIRYLADTSRRAFEMIASEFWLYTAADPSRDRIPLPDNSLVCARMGALPTQRGAQGTFLPWHGLSYVRGANDVAALVATNTDTTLQARFYAFPEKPHDMTVRVWRLLPGTYKATLSKDANDDGRPEETIWEKNDVAVDRGAFVDLTLPPRQPVVLTLSAVKTTPFDPDRADPAIGRRDIKMVYNEHLLVSVHNIGTRAVENLLVRVRDGHSGKVIGEKRIPRLGPPVALTPSKTGVEFLNFNCVTNGSIIVEIDPEREIDDLNRHNNKVVYEY